MNHLQLLAQFVSDLSYDRIPEDVVSKLKLSIVDTIACGLHGGATPWGRLVGEYAARSSGNCPVWATGARVDAGSAALANGTMVHSFEMDDLHLGSRSHPGGVTIPVVFALAADGVRVSGREALESLAAGYELTIRVGMCQGVSSFERGWHPTGTSGCFGAAASAAKTLRLAPEATQHAIGIAGTMPCGLMAAQYGGMVKRLYAGHAGMVGVMSARLAQGGFTGIAGIFDVEFGGYLDAVSGGVDRTWLSRGLGTTFEAQNVGIKLYPSVGASHTALDALKAIIQSHRFDPASVDSITVTTSEYQKAHAGWPYLPSTVMAAQMSIQYACAMMLLHGNVSVEQYAVERIADPVVLELTKKVRVLADPRQGDQDRGARVDVILAGGEVFSREVKVPKGHAGNPATWDDVVNKFTIVTAQMLDNQARSEIVGIVQDLEILDDINTLQEYIVNAGKQVGKK